jgi:hypothetical protein
VPAEAGAAVAGLELLVRPEAALLLAVAQVEEILAPALGQEQAVPQPQQCLAAFLRLGCEPPGQFGPRGLYVIDAHEVGHA